MRRHVETEQEQQALIKALAFLAVGRTMTVIDCFLGGLMLILEFDCDLLPDLLERKLIPVAL